MRVSVSFHVARNFVSGAQDISSPCVTELKRERQNKLCGFSMMFLMPHRSHLHKYAPNRKAFEAIQVQRVGRGR